MSQSRVPRVVGANLHAEGRRDVHRDLPGCACHARDAGLVVVRRAVRTKKFVGERRDVGTTSGGRARDDHEGSAAEDGGAKSQPEHGRGEVDRRDSLDRQEPVGEPGVQRHRASSDELVEIETRTEPVGEFHLRVDDEDPVGSQRDVRPPVRLGPGRDRNCREDGEYDCESDAFHRPPFSLRRDSSCS